MKKFLFLFINCLMLTGCFTKDTKPINDTQGIAGDVYVKEIMYNGHLYIEFKDNGINGQGWVHDPECFKKDINVILNNN